MKHGLTSWLPASSSCSLLWSALRDPEDKQHDPKLRRQLGLSSRRWKNMKICLAQAAAMFILKPCWRPTQLQKQNSQVVAPTNSDFRPWSTAHHNKFGLASMWGTSSTSLVQFFRGHVKTMFQLVFMMVYGMVYGLWHWVYHMFADKGEGTTLVYNLTVCHGNRCHGNR